MSMSKKNGYKLMELQIYGWKKEELADIDQMKHDNYHHEKNLKRRSCDLQYSKTEPEGRGSESSNPGD